MEKVILIACFLAVCLVVTPSSAENTSKTHEDAVVKNNTYTTKYDNVDLNDVLHSDRLLLNYVNCLLGKSHCTPDGTELKKNLPDAINNDCKKCSERQKDGSEQVMHYLINNKPEWWEELEKMYNPDGSYKKAYLTRQENAEKNNAEDGEDKKD